MQPLQIDVQELMLAFENVSWDMSYYLDRETGGVLVVTEETRKLLDELWEAEQSGGEIAEDSWLAVMLRNGMPEWMQESLQVAAAIERDDGSRFLAVPRADASEDYRDMVDFLFTVESNVLQERLGVALDGPGAFRRFRRVLSDNLQERQRWYAFKQARVRRRVLEWLERQGIEPLLREQV